MRYAVNKHYNMCMYAWSDKNPVHIISTADATTAETVERKKGYRRLTVKCPTTLKNYNKEMGGVDRFNRLMSLFSINKANKFTKFYKSAAMVIFDFVLVNAFLHWKMANKSRLKKNKKGLRLEFMNLLIQQMLDTDYPRLMRNYKIVDRRINAKSQTNMFNDDANNENDEKSIEDMMTRLLHLGELHTTLRTEDNTSASDETTCFPIDLTNIGKETSKRNNYCRICVFEGRGFKRKTQYCQCHGVFLCTTIHEDPRKCAEFYFNHERIASNNIKDWSFLCSNQSISCWEKAHRMYFPEKLFTPNKEDDHNISTKLKKWNSRSSPFLKRKRALHGIENGYERFSTKQKKKLQKIESDDTKQPSNSKPLKTTHYNYESPEADDNMVFDTNKMKDTHQSLV